MDSEQTQKAAFAAMNYRHPELTVFEIALRIFPDTAVALRVSQEWPSDAFVLSEISRLAGEESDQENYIPTKEELAREIWKWISEPGYEVSDRIKAAELFAKINDYVPKPESKPQAQQTNVMLVQDYGDALTWEQRLQQQQTNLIIEGEREVAGDRIV